jgi:serine/threonine protein kinase
MRQSSPEMIEESAFTVPSDWSGTGRGRHVVLSRDEKFPLPIGRQIGRGSTSDVHATVCRGSTIAVKRRYLPRAVPSIDPYEKEMKSLERLSNHRHIVKIVGSFVHGRTIGILLWPVAICDLGTYLDDCDTLNKNMKKELFINHETITSLLGVEGAERLLALNALVETEKKGLYYYTLSRLTRICGCLAGALSYIHEQRIKHKDIKPSNVLLTQENVYLTDFGVSSDFAESTGSVTDQGIRGTPKYFAPEVAEYQPNGTAADVFSLGCLFLEMQYVECHIPLASLRNKLPSRDHSFQANLEMMDQWFATDTFSWTIDGNARQELMRNTCKEMLARNPQQRPRASEVYRRLRESHTSIGEYLCGRCCRSFERVKKENSGAKGIA